MDERMNDKAPCALSSSVETEHIPEALPPHSLHMGRTQKVLVAGKKSIFGGNKAILRRGQSLLPGPCPARGNLIQWDSRSLHVLQTLEATGSQTQFAGASQKQPERSVWALSLSL